MNNRRTKGWYKSNGEMKGHILIRSGQDWNKLRGKGANWQK